MPVMPLSDVVGRVGTVCPAQMLPLLPKLNAGVTMGFTVTVKVTGGAQGSELLVNVYTPLVVLLTTAGSQVPVMPLSEVVGNAGTASPAQIVIDEPKLNTGGTIGFTVCV